MLIFIALLLAVVAGLLFVIVLVIQSEAQVGRDTATYVWEYKTVYLGESHTEEMQLDLTLAGNAGWELAGLTRVTLEDGTWRYAGVFKRPKERGILPIPRG